MSASSIDDAIAQMTSIIAESRQQATRLGFFCALYRRVTMRVAEGITNGRFEDGARMAAFDVLFANRYLEAYAQYQAGDPCTQSWQVAFDTCRESGYLILQHLLLGMNAHINLDLGIAAAQVAPGEALAGLEHDFNEINVLLAELVADVQRQIATVSPWLGFLDLVGGRSDEAVINFSMEHARRSAWDYATKLSVLSAGEQAETIGRRDKAVADFASFILRPSLTVNTAIFLIWLRELREAPTILDILSA